MAGTVHQDRRCNSVEAVAFVKRYTDEAANLAKGLDVPTENILGLAAEESQYGEGRIAKTYNNFFSMHAPAPLQTGSVAAARDPKVQVATYPSFEVCGQSFAQRFGPKVRGKRDAHDFAKALIACGYNSGDSKTGGRDDFEAYLVQIIEAVRVRMTCETAATKTAK